MMTISDSDRPSQQNLLRQTVQAVSFSEVSNLKKYFDQRYNSEKLDFYHYKRKKRNYKFNDANLERFIRRKLQTVLVLQNVLSITLLFNRYFDQLNESDRLMSERVCRFLLIIQSALTFLFLVLLTIGEIIRLKLKEVR